MNERERVGSCLILAAMFVAFVAACVFFAFVLDAWQGSFF